MENEKRLIDLEKAKKDVMGILAGKVNTVVAVKVGVAMQEATVDAVEVVRCKDCKKYKTINCSCGCTCVSDNWYCADGERKDNERKAD